MMVVMMRNRSGACLAVWRELEVAEPVCAQASSDWQVIFRLVMMVMTTKV